MDMRPVVNSTAKLVVATAGMMLVPMVVDAWHGDPNWRVFAMSALLLALGGWMVVIATRRADEGFALEQAFLLTAVVWIAVPVAGALPFMLGAPGASFTQAVFEAMSGMTTTGTTVFAELDSLPRGTNIWRAILHWMGGLGIVVVAMLFLPAMRVGGMQFFRSEGFDTQGKALPRARDIAAELTLIYIGLTAACLVSFLGFGMGGYDAFFHALSTVSTGGFSNYDASFGTHLPGAQYAACVFMVLASVPFVRLMQAAHGRPEALWRDPQVRAYIRWILYASAAVLAWRLTRSGDLPLEQLARESLFNVISTFSGTGFGLSDVTAWGAFPLAVLIIVGLIGGCTGSTGCAIKVFRFLVLMEAVRGQIRRMRSPHRVVSMRYGRRVLDEDVIDSVVSFFTLFILTFGLLIVGLSLTELTPRTALTAAWTAIANVGPVWGPEVSANGGVSGFSDTALWMMIVGMYLGRLEIITVLVLLLPRFWQTQSA